CCVCARQSFPTRRSSDLGVDRLGLDREHVRVDELDARALGRLELADLVLEPPLEHRLVEVDADGAIRRASTDPLARGVRGAAERSEEHTSELQSREKLVC